jgi:hypothetical protein
MPDELDPLRSAFEQVRASVLPSIRPPGADRVTATVRRRRTVRSSVAGFAAVLMVLLGVWVVGAHGDRHGPPSTEPSSPVPSLSVLPSVPPPSLSAGPSATITAGAGPTVTHHPAGGAGSPCVTDGIAEMVSMGSQGWQIQFFPVQDGNLAPCPGYRIPVYWATYSLKPDGTGTLYAKGTIYLDAQHIRRSVPYRAPATCATVFIGHDWSSTPGTLSAYVMGDTFQQNSRQPFWDHKHDLPGVQWDRFQPCPSPPTAPPSRPRHHHDPEPRDRAPRDLRRSSPARLSTGTHPTLGIGV